MAEPTTVVVIGDALIDELRTPEATSDFVGGAALNVAVGLRSLGVHSTLAAMVGADQDGAAIRGFLAEHQVALIESAAPNGSSRAISDRSFGEPRYQFNDAAKRRRIDFTPELVDAIGAARFVVVSCFPFDDQQQFDQLETAIGNQQTRLIIDPNPREGMMSDRSRFVRNFERLAAASLLTKIGEEDAELLYGESLELVCARLTRSGAGTVLATAGAGGASVHSRSGILVHEPIADLAGAIIDTMGAGDATLAAVTRSLVRGVPRLGEQWKAVLAEAMMIAGLTCRSTGALLRQPS